MRLTHKLQQFIEGPHGMSLGTRNAEYVPDFARVIGAQPLDNDQIMFLIDAATATIAIDNIKDNGILALVIASITTFESYQFKGRCVHHGPANEEQQQLADHYMTTVGAVAEKAFGFAPDIAFNFPHSDIYALVLEVDEVFEQTPKQGTGNKLS